MSQQITKAEREKDKVMDTLEPSSQSFRKARTRSILQLGGLIAKAGLLETFGLTLGNDFQRDPETQKPIAALFKGLLLLNEIAQSNEAQLQLWAQEGLQALSTSKQEKKR